VEGPDRGGGDRGGGGVGRDSGGLGRWRSCLRH
jgi:hypothetical protein